MQPVARPLIMAGAVLLFAGILVHFGRADWLSWFGHLPGDFRLRRREVEIFFPLTSMLLLSLAVSLLFGLLRRLF